MDHLATWFFLAMLFQIAKLQKKVKCARTKSTAIVKHAIAPANHKRNDDFSKVTLSPAFSLLLDESTDRGVTKHEGTLIRYLR